MASGLRVGGNLLMVPIILYQLPSGEVGLWYIFLSLGLVFNQLDLGFGQSVVRATGYLWGGAKRLQTFGFSSNQKDAPKNVTPNTQELSKLIGTIRSFYLVLGSISFAIISVGISFWIWNKAQETSEPQKVLAAWLIYCLSCSLNLAIGFWGHLLVGINHMKKNEQLFIISLLANYSVSLSGLLLDFGILALALGNLAMSMVYRILAKKYFEQLSNLKSNTKQARFCKATLAILWPNSWRSGVMSLGNYLTLSASPIVCASILTLSETASYGLALQLFRAINQISAIWTRVKIPLYHQLRVQNHINEIKRIFYQRVTLNFLTYVSLSTILIIFGPTMIDLIGGETTLPTVFILSVIGVSYGLETMKGAVANMVLTENKNPFWLVWLLSGVAVLVASIFFSGLYGIVGLPFAMIVVGLVTSYWWSVRELIRSFRGIR
ncbi:MAG: hypothetical protein AAGA18_12975 [Verrucomicrobiota bacterium]